MVERRGIGAECGPDPVYGICRDCRSRIYGAFRRRLYPWRAGRSLSGAFFGICCCVLTIYEGDLSGLARNIFSMFLQAFLSPINNFGMVQLKIVMVVNALLFFAALFGVVWAATGLVLREKKSAHMRLTIFSIILFAILDADVFTEIFSGIPVRCPTVCRFPARFLLLCVCCY